MPTISISIGAVANTLLAGFAVILVVLWLLIHLTAARDLRKSSQAGLNYLR
ncbi:MAG TPA: hypothetical protein VFZ27_05100 [Terriglobia bacterium]|nr:hypothetical protein [Terriglobia bacterium]